MRAGRSKKNKTETDTAIQRLKKQMPLWDYGYKISNKQVCCGVVKSCLFMNVIIFYDFLDIT